MNLNCFIFILNIVIEKDFIKYVSQFTENVVFSDTFLQLKTINGQMLTGQELYGYFENYFRMIASDEIEMPHDLERVSNIECNNLNIV